MNGILVVDKPKGMTSHDVVSTVKRRLRAQKVGHLGTLDPNATGVLPLVINRSTKLANYIVGRQKAYTATMKLGEETDTYDVEGTVAKTISTDGITQEAIKAALDEFVGTIMQVPPMYSAVKRKGTPLYKLARKGVVVEREAKEIDIDSIEVLDISLPFVVFNVECSRGTYIRTLCHDVGNILGVGGHLFDLRRTLSGCFTLDEAITLEATKETMLEAMISEGETLARLYPEVEVDSSTAVRIIGGTSMVGLKHFPDLEVGDMVRLVSEDRLIALASFAGDGIFKVLKLFEAKTIRENIKIRANS